MKRIGLFLMAVLLVAGCGSGGNDVTGGSGGKTNIVGTWEFKDTFTGENTRASYNVVIYPEGFTEGTVIYSYPKDNVVGRYPGSWKLDGNKVTLTAAHYDGTSNNWVELSGTVDSGSDSMSGSAKRGRGRSYTWTASLTSRSTR